MDQTPSASSPKRPPRNRPSYGSSHHGPQPNISSSAHLQAPLELDSSSHAVGFGMNHSPSTSSPNPPPPSGSSAHRPSRYGPQPYRPPPSINVTPETPPTFQLCQAPLRAPLDSSFHDLEVRNLNLNTLSSTSSPNINISPEAPPTLQLPRSGLQRSPNRGSPRRYSPYGHQSYGPQPNISSSAHLQAPPDLDVGFGMNHSPSTSSSNPPRPSGSSAHSPLQYRPQPFEHTPYGLPPNRPPPSESSPNRPSLYRISPNINRIPTITVQIPLAPLQTPPTQLTEEEALEKLDDDGEMSNLDGSDLAKRVREWYSEHGQLSRKDTPREIFCQKVMCCKLTDLSYEGVRTWSQYTPGQRRMFRRFYNWMKQFSEEERQQVSMMDLSYLDGFKIDYEERNTERPRGGRGRGRGRGPRF